MPRWPSQAFQIHFVGACSSAIHSSLRWYRKSGISSKYDSGPEDHLWRNLLLQFRRRRSLGQTFGNFFLYFICTLHYSHLPAVRFFPLPMGFNVAVNGLFITDTVLISSKSQLDLCSFSLSLQLDFVSVLFSGVIVCGHRPWVFVFPDWMFSRFFRLSLRQPVEKYIMHRGAVSTFDQLLPMTALPLMFDYIGVVFTGIFYGKLSSNIRFRWQVDAML